MPALSARVSGKRHWSERTANAMAKENRRLKRMYADVSMQNGLLKEALGKMKRPAQRRELAVRAVAMKGVSIALACRAFDVARLAIGTARIAMTRTSRSPTCCSG